MARVDGFHQNGLDRLVREGAVTWCGRAATRGGRSIAFAPPDETWMLGAPQTELAEKGEARRVLDYLEVHGASFLHQMAGDLNEAPSHLAETLWSLIWAGWASNDSLAPAWGGKPDPSRWGGRRQIPWGGGRWSMRCVSGSERTEDEDQAALRIMLDRYGLLSRELVERESLGLRWRGAYPMLSRMEWGGDLDRGLFVDDLSGLQFAATGAAAAMSDEEVDDEMILVHASDPANVWGDVFPILRPDGERYALRHHLGNYLVLKEGRPVLGIENRGERLVSLADLGPSCRRDALGLLAKLVQGPMKRPSVRVRTWDGTPVTATPAAAELEDLGFMREDRVMILYRGFGEEG